MSKLKRHLVNAFKGKSRRQPFGSKPHADRDKYLELYEEATARLSPEVDRFEAEKEVGVNRQWLDELALSTQVVVKTNPLDWNHGRVLYAALCERLGVDSHPFTIILETGTARGYSSVVMSRALLDCNVPGVVFTVDRIAHQQEMMWNCIHDHDGPRSRAQLLTSWPDEVSQIVFIELDTEDFLKRVSLYQIHFAFLDGAHTYDAVMAEFRYVEARQLQGDVVVIDDVTPGIFDGICNAVDTIEREGKYNICRLQSSSTRGYAICTRK